MSDETLAPTILRRESRSYLQYIRESFPWAQGESEAMRNRVLALADAENHAQLGLARLLQKRRIPLPSMTGFPVSFTSSNFVSVDYLLPRLIEAQKEGIAALESDLPAIQDPEWQMRVHAYLELKSKHLRELELLVSQQKAA